MLDGQSKHAQPSGRWICSRLERCPRRRVYSGHANPDELHADPGSPLNGWRSLTDESYVQPLSVGERSGQGMVATHAGTRWGAERDTRRKEMGR